MQVHLGNSRPQPFQRVAQRRLIQTPAAAQPEQHIVAGQPRAKQPAPHPARAQRPAERRHPPRTGGAGRDRARQPQRFEWHAHRAHAETAADAQDPVQHERMQVVVLMRVDVIERQPGVGERLKLRTDLLLGLVARPRTCRVSMRFIWMRVCCSSRLPYR